MGEIARCLHFELRRMVSAPVRIAFALCMLVMAVRAGFDTLIMVAMARAADAPLSTALDSFYAMLCTDSAMALYLPAAIAVLCADIMSKDRQSGMGMLYSVYVEHRYSMVVAKLLCVFVCSVSLLLMALIASIAFDVLVNGMPIGDGFSSSLLSPRSGDACITIQAFGALQPLPPHTSLVALYGACIPLYAVSYTALISCVACATAGVRSAWMSLAVAGSFLLCCWAISGLINVAIMMGATTVNETTFTFSGHMVLSGYAFTEGFFATELPFTMVYSNPQGIEMLTESTKTVNSVCSACVMLVALAIIDAGLAKRAERVLRTAGMK